MGLLGKLLLVGNLVAAAGVVYAAGLDYAARQNLQANAVRHQLVLDGLPVAAPAGVTATSDTVPVSLAMPGLVRVESVSKTLLDAHFSGSSGDGVGGTGAVATQLDEVQKVETALTGRLGGTAGEVLAILCGKFTPGANGAVVYSPGLLAGMAESFGERELIRRLVDPAALEKNPALVDENAATARALLEKKFAAARTVDSQAAAGEADRVKEKTEALKKAADESKAKFDAYAAAIQDAPTTDEQRAAQATAIAEAEAAAKTLAAAQADLDRVFADLGAAASRDEGDRARRIAHLLVHAGESAGWQKRVALVVGLRAYAQALTDQATRLSRMTSSAEQQRTLDQARFSDEYETLKQLASGRAVLLAQQVAVRADLEVQRASDVEAVTQRRLVLAARRADLARLQGEVAAALAAQAEVEQKLYETQKQVGDTLRRNAEQEAALAAAETGSRN